MIGAFLRKKTETELFVKQVNKEKRKSIGWMRETGMRENGIVLRIRTGRGGRVHELKSGKEEGGKEKG